MFSQCRCFPCSSGPPLDPPQGPQPSRQVPPVICVSLSSHFCVTFESFLCLFRVLFVFLGHSPVIFVPFLLLPSFLPSLDIFHEKSNGFQINVEAKTFKHLTSTSCVPCCVTIICISERVFCMNEKKIVLANFCLGNFSFEHEDISMTFIGFSITLLLYFGPCSCVALWKPGNREQIQGWPRIETSLLFHADAIENLWKILTQSSQFLQFCPSAGVAGVQNDIILFDDMF